MTIDTRHQVPMNLTLTAGVLLTVTLMGCTPPPAPPRYNAPDAASEAKFSRDRLECELLAREAVPRGKGLLSPLLIREDRQRFFTLCMESRGY